ncbi:uncharacterized protein TRAVEDRAFT_148196 [Trametes versicolor FP-101664 SS1]|uniref:uncharacterized protein n=1 Tax=Trametes versicolor (strain FP-101664) TaxID=717944 RepID=UPI000462403A|nr:uncharacterized protein TRAVEDRAFT_148196 [Trametes versicolor FP-101664 SS1]EIW58144.1 hypothetical protein TRAVEDRAFT_148196 [Trametes versicolor FP-101664 SS1]
MTEPIVFYDLPGKDDAHKAVSSNTWKTRFALNIKGIPYKTVWVEHPDIPALSRKIGAPPTGHNADGSPQYTLPAISDPNTKTVLADSALIVRYLDKTYPDTARLIPAGTDALHAAFDHAFHSVLDGDLRPLVVNESANALLPRGAAHFRATREAFFGGPLQEIAPPGSEKRAKHWAGVKKAFGTFAQWFQADGADKPFLLGDSIGYADVTLAAVLVFMQIVLGEDGKEWADLKTWDEGRWTRYVDAFKKYEGVDVGEMVVL